MRIFVIGLMMLGLAGCSFAPDYQRPKMELPQAWKDPGKGEQLDEQWWKRFDDSTLNALVQEALIANRDIAAAVARVDYARAQLGVARAELLPLLSGQAQGTQTWVDNTKITSGSQSPFSVASGRHGNLTSGASSATPRKPPCIRCSEPKRRSAV